MLNQILLYVGSGVIFLWGVGHIMPTRSVVKDFGEISKDNKLIITMEWIVEGVALVFIGAIVLAATLMDRTGDVSKAVYLLSFVMLNVLSAMSLKTGFNPDFSQTS